ncbi:DNA mismatch repair protein MutT [Polymorphobacter glacialis]|uniref:DNA mismatch repair protein MutT n=1 Tax=Sandarakinorhabdus glacialis TaxID=1614636 RepID=A0A916ZRA3_9SPHN|nr:NUDIX domain-containing protein [Polymorphobacter glacialis]GGE10109.1 DNA mismatch repair protein MutT [Polymorphobacter glacialis]
MIDDAPDRSLPPIRPKDAATLLVIRRDGPVPRVLMGRRVGGHAFMPDKWVFPGGRIHPSDFRVPVARGLGEETAGALARTCTIERARALAATAIRETFEETGLIVGQRGEGQVSKSSEWGEFVGAGYLPDLAPLEFVARAITPPLRTRRFDARFFTVGAEHLVSLEPGAGSGELDEIAWFDWEAAGGLDLPSITRAILGEVALRESERGRAIPYHRFDRGKHRLLAV